MRAEVWGCRGSLAAPGPETAGVGGNTSCVEIRLDSGDVIVLDAGTGIRRLGDKLARDLPPRIHLLLTHLHLDHIEGLGFFAPLWMEEAVIDVWGPPSTIMSLEERISRYLSPPLFPLRMSQIPSACTFRDITRQPLEIGSASIEASPVEHVGPTVGYRINEDGRSLAYIPDHEPALDSRIEQSSPDWLSGGGTALGADVLLHDAQYLPHEYADRLAWGHSSFEDTVAFAQVCKVSSLVLFHHDPTHTDADLAGVEARARELWGPEGEPPRLAREGMIIDV